VDEPAADLFSIFAKAQEIDSIEERDRFLADSCLGRPELRAEVESLIRALALAGDFLESTATMSLPVEDDWDHVQPGSMIGPYRVLEWIGEGGMGVVFAAEQTHPIRRKVALKLIKPGMDSREILRRFEAERHALALMDHPNIAKVLDAGTSDDGRPYFVMELIQGIPITEYCDRSKLTPRERLVLLVSVCRAVQHAHQKGIIHRDIKPSNVLVSLYDGVAIPKVIDFGVAKAVDQTLDGSVESSRPGVVVGTLEYMSPEQADNRALDVDTRIDVYALGVLLFELTTGSTPLKKEWVHQAGYAEILRRIRDEDSPKLSERLSKSDQLAAIAARRGIEPLKLARLVRGELDWIARKSLEKDRVRRYPTANDLARDIQRYLDGEPVEAGPPSSLYRFRKFALKHGSALVGAGLVAAILVIATGVSSWQAIRAIREESRARESEIQTKAVLRFLRDRVLAAARPQGQKGGLGRDVTLQAAIDAAEPKIAEEFANQPIVEASVRETLGATYLYLVEAERAAPQHLRALTLREQALGPDHAETLASLNNLAVAYQQAGQYAQAIPLHRRVLDHSRATLGPVHPETLKSLNNLATAYRNSGRTEDAISLLEELLQLRTIKLGPDHVDTLSATNNLAVAYRQGGFHSLAAKLLEPSLAKIRAKHGPSHPDTLKQMSNLAGVYLDAGSFNDALKLFGETLDLRRDKLGPDHPDTLTSLNNLAAAYQAAGRSAQALPLLEQAYEARKRKRGSNHPDTLNSLNNLAVARQAAGQVVEAILLYERVLEGRETSLEKGHPDSLRSMNNLAASYLQAGRWEKAERVLRHCLELRETKKSDDWRRFQTKSLLGSALVGLKRYGEAEPLLIEGYEGLGEDDPAASSTKKKGRAVAGSRIVELYQAWGMAEKADSWRAKLGTSTPKAPLGR
jgi:tetratricopeptide (TPR) repeat protein